MALDRLRMAMDQEMDHNEHLATRPNHVVMTSLLENGMSYKNFFPPDERGRSYRRGQSLTK